MPDTTVQPKVYHKVGGLEHVVASGGTQTIESGGVLTAASGSTVTLAGTTNVTGTMSIAGTTTLTDPIVTNVTRAAAQLDKVDATLANIVGLVQTVAIGTYRFRYVLPVTCGGTGGVKTAFKYTTTVVSTLNCAALGYTASAVALALTTTTTDQATHIATNTANQLVVAEGTMIVTTGGTVQLQFAENSANSTSSVLIGAYMEFTRIA